MSTLDDIEARIAAATPGPWSMENVQQMPDGFPGLYADIEPMIAGGVDPADGDLIAHAPTDLAALVKFARKVEDIVEHDWARLENPWVVLDDALSELGRAT